MDALLETFETQEEKLALEQFKREHPDLFKKDDAKLARHLGLVISLLIFSTFFTVTSSAVLFKIVFGIVSAFFWFCLINVTLHHHQTHRNAAESPALKKILDLLYVIAVPNAPKRKSRYTRAHLNHHLRPFHETDIDHHYGTERFLRMMRRPWQAFLYYWELTFVGGHVPGWEDDRYMNQVPLEEWTRRDYEAVKKVEVRKARRTALWQWGAFILLAFVLPALAWGWVFPMLLVKNWAHFLGQFQHYQENFLEQGRSLNQRTKTFRIPGWINYLTGGEISGHFLHHLYPEMPYYNVEAARAKMAQDPQLSKLFVIY